MIWLLLACAQQGIDTGPQWFGGQSGSEGALDDFCESESSSSPDIDESGAYDPAAEALLADIEGDWEGTLSLTGQQESLSITLLGDPNNSITITPGSDECNPYYKIPATLVMTSETSLSETVGGVLLLSETGTSLFQGSVWVDDIEGAITPPDGAETLQFFSDSITSEEMAGEITWISGDSTDVAGSWTVTK